MITQRLSCDNFPSKGNSNFSGGVGVSHLSGTFSLVEVQGFCRILPDFGGAEQLSIPLNLLIAKGFHFSQQALSIGASYADHNRKDSTGESSVVFGRNFTM
jgi:hypothetical protein